jgi:DNA-binding protein HU-beta
MNKAELVSAMSAKTGMTKVDSAKALNAFIEVVKDTVHKKENVVLTGFGSFNVVQRSARKGTIKINSPKLKINKAYTVPARKVVKFNVGAQLAQAVR